MHLFILYVIGIVIRIVIRIVRDLFTELYGCVHVPCNWECKGREMEEGVRVKKVAA